MKYTIWFLFLIWGVFKWGWKCPKIKIVAMVEYHCTYTTNHWIVHFNWLNCILCEFHLSESESRSVVSNSLWPHELYSLCNFPGQNTGMGSLSLLKGIFPTDGKKLSTSKNKFKKVLTACSMGHNRIIWWEGHSQGRKPDFRKGLHSCQCLALSA